MAMAIIIIEPKYQNKIDSEIVYKDWEFVVKSTYSDSKISLYHIKNL